MPIGHIGFRVKPTVGGGGGGAVAFDSSIIITAGEGNISGASGAFNNVGGNYIVVAVGVNLAGGQTVTSGHLTGVSYAGNALTLIGSRASGSSSSYLFLYGAATSSVGSNTLACTITASTSCTIEMMAVTASGATSTTGFNSSTVAATNSTALSFTPTSSQLLVAAGTHGDTISASPASGWGTSIGPTNVNGNTAGGNVAGGYVLGSGASKSVQFLAGTNDWWNVVAVMIQ